MNNTEKRLAKAGLYPSKNVVVNDARHVEVAVMDGDECDWDATEGWKNAVVQALSTDAHPWGGFRAAGGWWYLEKDYDSGPFESALRDQLGVAYYS